MPMNDDDNLLPGPRIKDHLALCWRRFDPAFSTTKTKVTRNKSLPLTNDAPEKMCFVRETKS